MSKNTEPALKPSLFTRQRRLVVMSLGFLIAAIWIVRMGSDASAREPETIEAAGSPGLTVFVDVEVIGKEDRAAARMTELHAEYARDGWTIITVTPLVANNNLEGFFLTYVNRP